MCRSKKCFKELVLSIYHWFMGSNLGFHVCVATACTYWGIFAAPAYLSGPCEIQNVSSNPEVNTKPSQASHGFISRYLCSTVYKTQDSIFRYQMRVNQFHQSQTWQELNDMVMVSLKSLTVCLCPRHTD